MSFAAVVATLLLGGGTRSGFLSDAVLQVIALALIAGIAWLALRAGQVAGARIIAILALSCIALAASQLAPLPPRVWSALPGRQALAEAYRLAGASLPWRSLSLDPTATWLAVLSTLPPIAIFVVTMQLSARERRRLSLALLAAGVFSVVVGLLQVAQGPSSPLRFFDTTNSSEAVGFFANRNHFAALLNVLILLASAWTLDLVKSMMAHPARKRFEGPHIIPVVASFLVVVILVAAQTMARSRAGLGLTIVALFGTVLLALPDRRRGGHRDGLRVMATAVAVAGLLALQFSLYRVIERFDADPLADARIPFARNTTALAKSLMPFGSGMGTFIPVYASSEPTADALVGTYANRAHNDILEVWLEHGVFAWALGAVFLAWLVSRAVVVWRAAHHGREIDHALPRAATLIIAILFAHSVFDYPLRTSALLGVFAFAAALLVPAPILASEDVVVGHDHAHRRRIAEAGIQRVAPHRPILPVAPSGAGLAGKLGRDDVKWPEAWLEPDRKKEPHDPK